MPLSRRSRLPALLFMSALLVSGLLALGSRQEAKDGGTLVIGDSQEPMELNCVRVNDSPGMRVCRLVTDTLVDYDPDLQLVPRLAEKFDVSPDGKTITFRLRSGVKWHDGKPFTARDVAYTIRQIQAPGAEIAGNRAALFEPLQSIETPDDLTVVARYREPFASAMQGWYRAFIVPAHRPFKPGEHTAADRVPVGTGPFRFVRWDPQQQIVLAANPEYFNGPPHVERIAIRYVPNAHSLVLAMESGDMDVAGIPPSEAVDPSAGARYALVKTPALSLDLILWNVGEPRGLFSDPRVRRALSMGFDRAAYIRKFTRGDYPAVSSFHPEVWAHDPSLKPIEFDPKSSAALLAAAGWKDRDGDGVLETAKGERASFTLLFLAGNPSMERIATMFQAEAKPLGIDARLQGLEWKLLLEKVRSHQFEATVYRWGLDIDPDPFDFFHSSQSAGGQNYGAYSNPEVDRLADEGRRTLDTARRAEIYHRIERVVREEQPYTFVAHTLGIMAVSNRVRGYEKKISGVLGWYPWMLKVWLAPAGPDPSPAR